MRKLSLILLFVLLVCSFANGQQGNNIAFGRYGGLNFNSSPPTLFGSGSIETDGSPSGQTATMSDCEGKLLFYANSDYVWDSYHSLMDNGNLIPIGETTNFGYYPILTFPYPDSIGCYIVIYGTKNSIRYAVIDMSQNSGLGKVVSKNNTITTNNAARTTDIIRNSNGKDFWFITKENDTEFYAYPVTKSGFGTPVKSTGYGFTSYSTIKANNKGDMIAISVGGYYYYKYLPTISPYPVFTYNFDNSTGKFSKPRQVLNWNQIENSEIESIQFSPNDSLLYLTNAIYSNPNFNDSMFLFQTKVKEMFPPVYYQNTLINEPYDWKRNWYGMLLGPDNKIYMAEGYDTNKIAVIHNPNVFGTGCNIQRGAIDIGTARTGVYMGTVYQPIYDILFATNARDSICTDTASFVVQGDTTPFKQYILYYGDGDSSVLDNSNRTGTHRYPAEDKYYVKFKAITKECNFPIWRTDSVTVRYNPIANFVIDSTVISCGKRTLYIRDSSLRADSFLFTWLDTKPAFTDSITRSFNFEIDSNATYPLTHAVRNDWGCVDTFRKSLAVVIPQFPQKGFSIADKDSAGCANHTVTLYDSAKKSTQTVFYWGDGDSLITTSPGNVVAQYQRTYTTAGVFFPYQIVGNTDGCSDTFYYPKSITILNKARAGFAVVADSTCNNILVTLNDTSSFADSIRYTSPFVYLGKQGTPATQNITKNGSYVFTQKVWNAYCADSNSVTIPLYKKQTPDVGLSSDALSGCSPLAVTFNDDSTRVPSANWALDFGNGNKVSGSGVMANQSYSYSVAGTYTVILSDTGQNGCYASDTISLSVFPVPDAVFTTSYTNQCGRLTVDLGDISPNADSIEIQWGDNIMYEAAKSNVTHQYPFSNKDTSRRIMYIAKTNNGCRDTNIVTYMQTAHSLPSVPNMLGVSVTDKGQITLEWEEVAGAQQYTIEHSKTGAVYSLLTTVIPIPSTVQTFVQNNQPTDELNLYYKIVATDSCKVKSQESRYAKTMVLKAVVDDDQFAVLEWTPYEDWENGVLEYKVEYRDKTLAVPNPPFITQSSQTLTENTDKLFAESLGDERCYRITAIESGGNTYQSYSNEVCLLQKPFIIIPNAFTPNGDGRNDVFTPTVSSIKAITMDIYNRYGQLIYSETSDQPKWDGTFQDLPVPIGSYMVMISAKGNNNRKLNYSGIVTLLR